MDNNKNDEMQTKICLSRFLKHSHDGRCCPAFGPLAQIADFSKSREKDVPETTRPYDESVPAAHQTCLSQWVAAEQSGSLAPSEQSQLTIEETKATPSQARNRDGHLCVATGTSDPNVCHIVAPIIWRHSPSSLIVAVQVSRLFGWDEDFYTRLRSKLLHEEEGYGGITTLMTNMICLGRELEPSWSEGPFALEPLEPLITTHRPWRHCD
ncbi:hypothetical protein CCUS01_07167 [Colletotrichum cuscutae]|uniref:HNH nuclease domain-containing protein n=1 Tax=Colletotrichum cuscutae TaxID=1209917 RepID=A0AAI9V1E7_9PEZI|nr:hypothetical protein CCUS01_07167 [Colletotrichum cuscutae]